MKDENRVTELLHAMPSRSQNAADIVTFDFATLTPRERHKLLIGAVVPRPIALGGHGYATTRDYFDLPTMSVDAFRQGRFPVRE